MHICSLIYEKIPLNMLEIYFTKLFQYYNLFRLCSTGDVYGYEQVKKKWDNIKTNTKRKFTDIRNHANKTGNFMFSLKAILFCILGKCRYWIILFVPIMTKTHFYVLKSLHSITSDCFTDIHYFQYLCRWWTSLQDGLKST